MRGFLLHILPCCLCLYACNAGTTPGKQGYTPPEAVQAPSKPPLETGKVIPAEPVTGSTATYALYLPAAYVPEKPWPVVLFFDAHGRGREPVARYQSLAEQYATVLVGSNASRNGQPPLQSMQLYDELMRDVKAKVAVDARRITTAGFSGGARVAAMVAQNRPDVASVIACAAGFQPRQGERFSYYALVGMEDFNYQELHQLEDILDATSQPHAIVYWDGGHEWPPVEVMEGALAFVGMRGMAAQDPGVDSMVAAARKRWERLDHALGTMEMMRWRALKALTQQLAGLADVAPERQRMEAIRASPQWAQARQAETRLLQEEAVLRDRYAPQIASLTVEEWRKIAQQLRGRHKELDLWQMRMRVANFLSLNTYFHVDRAFKSGNLPQMEHFLQVYALIDPPNPEHAYLTAALRMRQGRAVDAVQSLQAAQALGFKDADRLAADPEFTGLRTDTAFQRLLAQLRALP